MWDLGVLVLRLVVGLYLVGHGSQKLFGWFEGPGLQGIHGGMTMLRFRPAQVWTAAVVAGEVGGGLLMVLGLLSPLGPLGVAAAMFVAMLAAHWDKGLWIAKGGIELTLTYLAAAVAVGLTGPGRFSLDALLGTALPTTLAEAFTVLTALVVLTALATRRPAEAPAEAPHATAAASHS
jgi:putative oxidoreductase